jgi:hypothetical protein
MRARIDAGRDDIGQALIDDDLDVDIGINGQQAGERRLQDRQRRMLAGRDADRAGGALPRRHGRSSRGHAGDPRRGRYEQPQASSGRAIDDPRRDIQPVGLTFRSQS